jgi:hypothetical protein
MTSTQRIALRLSALHALALRVETDARATGRGPSAADLWKLRDGIAAARGDVTIALARSRFLAR